MRRLSFRDGEKAEAQVSDGNQKGLYVPDRRIFDPSGRPVTSQPDVRPKRQRPVWWDNIPVGKCFHLSGCVFEITSTHNNGIVAIFKGLTAQELKKRGVRIDKLRKSQQKSCSPEITGQDNDGSSPGVVPDHDGSSPGKEPEGSRREGEGKGK